MRPPGWLTSEPDVERPPARLARDWWLAGAVAGTALAEVALRDAMLWRPAAVPVAAVLALATLWRRTLPLGMVALGFGTLLVVDVAALLAAGEPFTLYAAAVVLVLVYALFRWAGLRRAAAGLVLVLAEASVAIATDAAGPTDAAGGVVVLLLPAALGLTVRYRRAAHVQQVAAVRSQEREVLARELHDTVAHHVSAIAVQAQAGRVQARSQDLAGATDALAVIEAEATRTLTEMRSMVGALRRAGSTEALSPNGVADIDALATRQGARGPRVDVRRTGDLGGLPVPVQAALYRVAQESVTNARRHARHATAVHVLVAGDVEEVRLTVSDDGERGLAAVREPGYGLVGMAERVALLGGTLAAGPRPDHGWTVDATIPRQGGHP